jgi:hypothetical protein
MKYFLVEPHGQASAYRRQAWPPAAGVGQIHFQDICSSQRHLFKYTHSHH